MRSVVKASLVYAALGLRDVVGAVSTNLISKPSLVIAARVRLLPLLAAHLRLATSLAEFRLIELFGYERPSPHLIGNIAVYVFASLASLPHLHVFVIPSALTPISSVASLFASSNWLERELAEMTNLLLLGKQDNRNLMLAYGDASAPLQRSHPSIGFREIYFNANDDLIVSQPVSIQF